MGPVCPTLGRNSFSYNAPRTVTVYIPVTATSSYSGYNYTLSPNYFDNSDTTAVNWGNGFKGMGWTSGGTFQSSGTMNADITLKFVTY